MDQPEIQKTETPPVAQSVPARQDTHSYKGWLNSDSFFKRALAVYGYGLVASLILMVPILIIFSLLFGFLIASFLGGMLGGVTNQYYPSEEIQGKLNINQICEESLAYTDFTDGAAAQAYVEECKKGKHPEVIEGYKQMMEPGEGSAI